MRSFLFLAQAVAPFVGLLGLALVLFGVVGDPQDFGLAMWGAGLAVLGLVFRPRRGHPMSDLLGKHPDRTAPPISQDGSVERPPKPPVETPAASAAPGLEAQVSPDPIAQTDAGALSEKTRERPHHAAPAKLIPLLPGEAGAGRSWIGGLPALPEDMAWPEAQGEPMMLLAQIALDELPEGIWGGLGPREGWLAFFLPCGGRIDEDLRVLHLTGPVAERDYPHVPERGFFYTFDDPPFEMLERAGQRVERLPLRWPLKVLPLDGQPPGDRTEPMVDGEYQRFAIQKELSLRDPAFRPFDRATAQLLIEALIEDQQISIRGRSRGADEPGNPRAGEKTSRKAAIAALEKIAGDLAAPDGAAPFTEQDAAELVVSVRQITVREAEKGPDGREVLGEPTSILETHRGESWTLKAYRVPFEMLVQRALRDDPARVPEAVRTRFMALWRADQASEFATMGGEVDGRFFDASIDDPVFLLALPSSNLIGWGFGDVSSLGVFISPEDLAAGRLDRAWGDIAN